MSMRLQVPGAVMAFVLFAALIVSAQTSKPSSSEMIAKLSSADPVERAVAFVGLERIGGLSGPSVSERLLNLLDRENRLIEETLRESGGQSGVSVKYGEDYAEYYGKLLGACRERCDKNNVRTLVVLANGAYSPSSEFAQQLARDYGKTILPALLQKTRSDIDGFRAEGIKMLGIIKLANPTFTPTENASIRSAVLAGTRDRSIAVREGAVEALGNIGTTGDIALLAGIAKSDDGKTTHRETTRYPVREQAEKAIKGIQQRMR